MVMRWRFVRAPPPSDIVDVQPRDARVETTTTTTTTVDARVSSVEDAPPPETTTTTTTTTTTKKVRLRERDDDDDDATKTTKTTKTTKSKKKTKATTKMKPSARAEAMALAFERGRGEALEGIETLDGWTDASTASGRARLRAATRDAAGATCAVGALRRDVVRADALEIWFGFSSNFRGVADGEKREARKAAKKFGSEFGSEESATTALVGFGAAFASTGEAFFVRCDDEFVGELLDDVFATCVVATYHAQDVVRAAMEAGAKNIDASTANVLDCRIDAWLMNPDRAFDGGIDDVVEDASKRRDGTSDAWSDALGCFQLDLATSLELCASAGAKLRAGAPARAVEAKVAVALGVLQYRGVGFDRSRASAQIHAANARVAELEAEARRIVRGIDNVNLASAAQVADVLYNKLKLPAPSAHAMKGSKTSHLTTSVEVLQALATQHPFPRVVLEHRGALKERAMCEGYDKAAVGDDASLARVHTTWNNTKTATGRLSSSHPNIQQVGRGSMRNLFAPPPGRTFVAADYSQIELRVLAHLSEDQRLISLLRKASDAGGDVFVYIWNAGKGLPLDAPVNAETRNRAKTTAYAIVYGQQATGLAEKLGISKGEAQGYIAAFHRAFPDVKQWIACVLSHAERASAVTLPMSGRHRALPKIHSRAFSERAEAQRQAVNSVIQGSAADLMKTAMLRFCSAAGKGAFADDVAPGSVDAARCTLVAQIHDELLFEVDDDAVTDVVRVVKRCMEHAIELSVPTPVKVSTGKSWGELTHVE